MMAPTQSTNVVNDATPGNDISALLADACTRATRYLDDIKTRRVFPLEKDVAALGRLREPMPLHPEDPSSILALLDEVGSPATVASNAGRYFGFVNGAAFPVCIAAQSLAAAWDQNGALRIMSPAAAVLEDVALSWLIDLFGLPADCAAALVTGAASANFTGLAAARHALLSRTGWDVENDGLFRAPELTVVVGEEAHVTVHKALALLGLGRSRVTVVSADSQGRMRADKLPHLDERTIVCVQAGNVNTGACDPIREICTVAARAGAWVHVDGAFGLWARVEPEHARLVDGLELADSWATDAHKWLNVTYDCGIAFVRDAASLRASMAAPAAYLLAGGEREPMYLTPESSRRARGVEVWAALRFLGATGVRDLIRGGCDRAQEFATALRGAGYSVLNEVVLNQVLVSFGDAAITEEVIRRVQREGTCWCGGTVWQGQTAMRISVSSWMTTSEDVERSVRAIVAAARAVRGED
ncbi:MAG TPA: aminotransferase class V-fold PLP-dependent enzyme [Bryobacteraceae bacterium]